MSTKIKLPLAFGPSHSITVEVNDIASIEPHFKGYQHTCEVALTDGTRHSVARNAYGLSAEVAGLRGSGPRFEEVPVIEESFLEPGPTGYTPRDSDD